MAVINAFARFRLRRRKSLPGDVIGILYRAGRGMSSVF